jgi:hypothetical protein
MWPLILIGGGIVYLALKKPSAATPSATANTAAAATNAANVQAANAASFYAQAQALGLSSADAQNAYSLGLSPQDYINAGMQGSAFGSVNPAGQTPSPLDPTYGASTSGNLLQWYGPGY